MTDGRHTASGRAFCASAPAPTASGKRKAADKRGPGPCRSLHHRSSRSSRSERERSNQRDRTRCQGHNPDHRVTHPNLMHPADSSPASSRTC